MSKIVAIHPTANILIIIVIIDIYRKKVYCI